MTMPRVGSRAADIMSTYGDNVSPGLANSIVETSDWLEIEPEWLANQIATETGGTFDPAQPNRAKSGAVGLIQFMPNTAARLLNDAGFHDFKPTASGRWTSDQKRRASKAFKEMTAENQMYYVGEYLYPNREKIKGPDDLGMAVFFPAAMGEGREFDIEDWYKRNEPELLETYKKQNKGIRTAGDYLDLVDKRSGRASRPDESAYKMKHVRASRSDESAYEMKRPDGSLASDTDDETLIGSTR